MRVGVLEQDTVVGEGVQGGVGEALVVIIEVFPRKLVLGKADECGKGPSWVGEGGGLPASTPPVQKS